MGVQAIVLGATGYVGGELLRLIHAHPEFQLAAAVSESRGNDAIGGVFPHLACLYPEQRFARPGAWADEIDAGAEVALFSTAPHGASAALIAGALELAAERGFTARVVDSSADFRYADPEAYRQVYGQDHGAPQLLKDFVCAVPEHAPPTSDKHVGHPGCFATAVLLAAVPLLRSGLVAGDLFVCGTTGSTGAGRAPQAGTHHPERHGNLYAYKPLAHRHAPEMEQLIFDATERRANVNFVPHSGPFARGIYVTLQAKLVSPASDGDLRQVFREYYEGAPFIQIVDGAPKLKDVVASNYARIGLSSTNGTVVVMAAIDNLQKGAAGGAMQWMNRLFGLPETAGLLAAAAAWT